MSYGYQPDEVTQYATVEVYLPKNLRNLGALVELLARTIEFYGARQWLVANADLLYDEPRTVAQLPDEARACLENKDTDRLRAYFADFDVKMQEGLVIVPAGSSYVLQQDGEELFSICRETLHVYQQNIWRKSGSFPTKESFKNCLERMDRTVEGYSIYEVDGAFRGYNKGTHVPVEVLRRPRTTDIEVLIAQLKGHEIVHVVEAVRVLLGNEDKDPFAGTGLELGGVSSGQLLDPKCLQQLRTALSGAAGYEVPVDAELRRCSEDTWELVWEYVGKEQRGTSCVLVVDQEGCLNLARVFEWVTEGARSKYILHTPGRDDDDYYVLQVTDEELVLQHSIRILEERTLVIRFLTNLHLDPRYSCVLAKMGEQANDQCVQNATRQLRDTMILIGLFFIHNLGAVVGIEDEIWATYGIGMLWRWKKG